MTPTTSPLTISGHVTQRRQIGQSKIMKCNPHPHVRDAGLSPQPIAAEAALRNRSGLQR